MGIRRAIISKIRNFCTRWSDSRTNYADLFLSPMGSPALTLMSGTSFGAPRHASLTNTRVLMSTKRLTISLSHTKSLARTGFASTSSECKSALVKVLSISHQTPTSFPMNSVTFTITIRSWSSTRARKMSGSWSLQTLAKEEVSI